MRKFGTFGYRGASYRISPADDESLYNSICSLIIVIREELEEYIKRQPEFLTSLGPVELLDDAPHAAEIMAGAAETAGLGPMAAVAGTIAMEAARKAAAEAAESGRPPREIIIENGGDIFILPQNETAAVTAGIFSGLHSKFSGLALRIIPEKGGTAVCSSSGIMGHSLSLGDCDLCTVFSSDAALADAAATLGGNLVSAESDLAPAAERIAGIRGVDGVLLIKNDKIAVAGRTPGIVRNTDPGASSKMSVTPLF